LIKALTASNNGNKQNKPKNLWRFRNRSRFNFSWTKKILSYGILTINILYSSITCFKGSNMFIYQIFTFHKIFNPHMTRSQVTGWNPLEGSTKSSCGKLRLGGTFPASNSRKG
jgi:hypothetical protein